VSFPSPTRVATLPVIKQIVTACNVTFISAAVGLSSIASCYIILQEIVREYKYSYAVFVRIVICCSSALFCKTQGCREFWELSVRMLYLTVI